MRRPSVLLSLACSIKLVYTGPSGSWRAGSGLVRVCLSNCFRWPCKPTPRVPVFIPELHSSHALPQRFLEFNQLALSLETNLTGCDRGICDNCIHRHSSKRWGSVRRPFRKTAWPIQMLDLFLDKWRRTFELPSQIDSGIEVTVLLWGNYIYSTSVCQTLPAAHTDNIWTSCQCCCSGHYSLIPLRCIGLQQNTLLLICLPPKFSLPEDSLLHTTEPVDQMIPCLRNTIMQNCSHQYY